jgi:hypothetical protein
VGCLFGIMYISGFGAPRGVGLHMWEDGNVGWFVYSCEGGFVMDMLRLCVFLGWM